MAVNKVTYELWGTVVDPVTSLETAILIDWDKSPDTMNTELNSIVSNNNTLPDGRTVSNLVVRTVILN